MTTENFIAEGRHAAVCRSIQFGLTKNQKEQVAIGFEIIGEDADAGRMITYFGTFDEAQPGKRSGAIDFTLEALRNLGWTGDDLAELPALAESGQLAEEVSIVVAHEEYEGTWRAKVKWVNKPGGGMVKLETPLDDRQLKTFAASMRNRLRGAAQRPTNGASRPAPTRHPNAPGGGNDDIPFATCDMATEPSPVAAVIRGGV
jgi:hypothetical protein